MKMWETDVAIIVVTGWRRLFMVMLARCNAPSYISASAEGFQSFPEDPPMSSDLVTAYISHIQAKRIG